MAAGYERLSQDAGSWAGDLLSIASKFIAAGQACVRVLRAGVQQLGRRPLELVGQVAGSWADRRLGRLSATLESALLEFDIVYYYTIR
jgi:hypothetical protein